MTSDTVNAHPARPLRKDAEQNRQKILSAAREVFCRRGLDATLDDVAHHAGLGVGTVYRRFPSKEHLVEAMFVDRLDEIAELAEKALTADDPWEGFTQLLWKKAELHTADRGLREIIFSKAYGHQEVAEARQRMTSSCRAVFERAQQSGQLRADVSPTDLPILQLILSVVAEYSQKVDPELWRRYGTLLLDGLRADSTNHSTLPGTALSHTELDHAMKTWRCSERSRT